jgi:bifunctional DNA-binding transcriptional regulator/antitoxin component of YhaV-PrlF toxin-antitoxin module
VVIDGSMEQEIDFVKVQLRKSGSFMITIPKQAVNVLSIKSGERLKVFVDKENKRIIYQKT